MVTWSLITDTAYIHIVVGATECLHKIPKPSTLNPDRLSLPSNRRGHSFYAGVRRPREDPKSRSLKGVPLK